MKEKIVETTRICLYCGKEIEPQWEENSQYYECNCFNAEKKREIEKEIRKLEMSIPRYNYEIVQKNVLYKKDGEWGWYSVSSPAILN